MIFFTREDEILIPLKYYQKQKINDYIMQNKILFTGWKLFFYIDIIVDKYII